MTRLTRVIAAGLLMLGFGGAANGQVTALVVGNQTSFNALDGYDGATGQFLGSGYGIGTGPPGAYYFTFGPNGNVFTSLNANPSPVLQYEALSGALVNTFIPTTGGRYVFGPDDNLYRLEDTGTVVRRYNGATGVLVDTFVTSNLTLAQTIRFGPSGDLFVGDGATIKRFSGTNGAFLGNLFAPGTGGLGAVFDMLFPGNGTLLVTGGGNNVFRFDETTGAFLGNFAEGNGLNGAYGITLGPDGHVYVASTSGNGSIKRFQLSNGAFVGDFVSMPAHLNPSVIGFSPFPIPEPSSCAMVGLVLAGYGFVRRSRLRVVLSAVRNSLTRGHHA